MNDNQLTAALTLFYSKYQPPASYELNKTIDWIHENGQAAFNLRLQEKYGADLYSVTTNSTEQQQQQNIPLAITPISNPDMNRNNLMWNNAPPLAIAVTPGNNGSFHVNNTNNIPVEFSIRMRLGLCTNEVHLELDCTRYGTPGSYMAYVINGYAGGMCSPANLDLVDVQTQKRVLYLQGGGDCCYSGNTKICVDENTSIGAIQYPLLGRTCWCCLPIFTAQVQPVGALPGTPSVSIYATDCAACRGHDINVKLTESGIAIMSLSLYPDWNSHPIAKCTVYPNEFVHEHLLVLLAGYFTGKILASEYRRSFC
jgi:hypothetical protein